MPLIGDVEIDFEKLLFIKCRKVSPHSSPFPITQKQSILIFHKLNEQGLIYFIKFIRTCLVRSGVKELILCTASSRSIRYNPF